MKVTFATQPKVELDLVDCPVKSSADLAYIIVECYGKGSTNTHYKLDRRIFNTIVTRNKLSEYDLMSRVYILNTPQGQKTAILKATQRGIMKKFENHGIQLIHMDFLIVNDDSEFQYYATVKVTGKENCADYKQGAVLHKQQLLKLKKSKEQTLDSINSVAYVDISKLSKNQSITYNDNYVVSLKKR
jgi:ribosomal protein L25 (general stress protein Ctc)